MLHFYKNLYVTFLRANNIPDAEAIGPKEKSFDPNKLSNQSLDYIEQIAKNLAADGIDTQDVLKVTDEARGEFNKEKQKVTEGEKKIVIGMLENIGGQHAPGTDIELGGTGSHKRVQVDLNDKPFYKKDTHEVLFDHKSLAKLTEKLGISQEEIVAALKRGQDYFANEDNIMAQGFDTKKASNDIAMRNKKEAEALKAQVSAGKAKRGPSLAEAQLAFGPKIQDGGDASVMEAVAMKNRTAENNNDAYKEYAKSRMDSRKVANEDIAMNTNGDALKTDRLAAILSNLDLKNLPADGSAEAFALQSALVENGKDLGNTGRDKNGIDGIPRSITIAAIQESLEDYGFNVGAKGADGKPGKDTYAALENFRKSQNDANFNHDMADDPNLPSIDQNIG